MSNMTVPVAARVIEVVALIVGDESVSITPDSHLFDDLQLDSLDSTELLIELEDEFDVVIPDEVSDSWKTVQDIIASIVTLERYVSRQLSQKAVLECVGLSFPQRVMRRDAGQVWTAD